MKTFNTAIIALIATSISLFSCKKSDEVKEESKIPPVINIVNTSHIIQSHEICGHEEDNVFIAKNNDTLTLEMKLSSENNLSQYKVSIHDNGDCHSHEERSLSVWEYSNIVDLSGKDTTVVEKIIIPSSADKSNYHLEIMAIDNAGLESEEVHYNLIIN